MKHKTITRKEWRGIYKRSYAEEEFCESGFTGKAGLIMMLDCDDCIINASGCSFSITHKGYSWLSVAPRGRNVWATVMFDENGKLFQCYFDITAGNQLDEYAASCFDDLYLDAVIRPDSDAVSVYDRDELDAALLSGDIDEKLHTLALNALDELLNYIKRNRQAFFEFCVRERNRLLGKLQVLEY